MLHQGILDVEVESRFIEVCFLKDHKFELYDVYAVYPVYFIGKITEDEKDDIIYTFTTSSFDDIAVTIDDIFENVL